MNTQALARHLTRLPWPGRNLNLPYVLRSVAAAALALILGIYLQLDAPFSAASTVLLLINPVSGAVVGKGLWRMVGTLVGMLAAFVLMGLFGQKPLLLILALGLWLGLCVTVMSLVRHFYATAVIVAGYTVCLGLGPALAEPQVTFEHVITRGSAVALGVCSLSLVTVVFSQKGMHQRLRSRLRELTAAVLQAVAEHCRNAPEQTLELSRRQWMGEVYAVDDLLGLARAESRRLNAAVVEVRGGLVALFSALTAFRIGATRPGLDDAEPALALTATALCTLAGQLRRSEVDFIAAGRALHILRTRLAAQRQAAAACGGGVHLERLEEQLDDLEAALHGFASLDRPRVQAPRRTVAFHRDYREALRNGARAVLATLIGGALWYFSGWDQGPNLLAVLGPYCTLLAATLLPAQGTVNFIKGTLYAIPAALVCKFLCFPAIQGLPLLILCLGVFWSFGIQATTVPRRALQGIAYLIAFNTLVATGNVAQYDFSDFANQACAWVLALCISLLAYHLVPKDPKRHVEVLLAYLHRETLVLLRRHARLDLSAWHARQQHRIAQLGALLGQAPERTSQALQLGLLSLQLGRELRQLQRGRSRLVPGSPVAACLDLGFTRIAAAYWQPAHAAVQARRCANSLVRRNATDLAQRCADLAWLLQAYARAAAHTYPPAREAHS
ncbi:MAG: p-hydroxybenzoic acid efflux pump subunit AaeB [Pseudomonas citronellolis]|nr:MAG: p-hydroxybenzoic acid efflux pump subunit AaeB [Pseudomonas citronellolis]